MPGASRPHTPSLTAPSSPTSPTSTVVQPGDYVINVDPEKARVETVVEIGRHRTENDSKDESLQQKVSEYLKGLTTSNKLPHFTSNYRKSDGRIKLVDRIDDHPEGYPQLAAFVNSDPNFMICRKYGYLRSRVLLYRQDELAQLERTLIALDDEDKEDSDDSRLALRSRKHDEARKEDPQYSRKTLIQKIDDKLKEYDDLIGRIKTYASLNQPCRRDRRSFVNWIWDEKPISPDEIEFSKHEDDFVALADGSECGWLDGVVEDILVWCLPKQVVKRIFTSSAQRKKSDDKYLRLLSKFRIDILVRLVLTLTTVGLLVGPSAILFIVPGHATMKILLIMAFTLLFSAAVSVSTKAKRHEMLAATATYAAVLVVFLGNFNPGN